MAQSTFVWLLADNFIILLDEQAVENARAENGTQFTVQEAAARQNRTLISPR